MSDLPAEYFRFLSLPAELRNSIYQFYYTVQEIMIVTPHNTLVSAPLANVSQQVRNEYMPIHDDSSRETYSIHGGPRDYTNIRTLKVRVQDFHFEASVFCLCRTHEAQREREVYQKNEGFVLERVHTVLTFTDPAVLPHLRHRENYAHEALYTMPQIFEIMKLKMTYAAEFDWDKYGLASASMPLDGVDDRYPYYSAYPDFQAAIQKAVSKRLFSVAWNSFRTRVRGEGRALTRDGFLALARSGGRRLTQEDIWAWRSREAEHLKKADARQKGWGPDEEGEGGEALSVMCWKDKEKEYAWRMERAEEESRPKVGVQLPDAGSIMWWI